MLKKLMTTTAAGALIIGASALAMTPDLNGFTSAAYAQSTEEKPAATDEAAPAPEEKPAAATEAPKADDQSAASDESGEEKGDRMDAADSGDADKMDAAGTEGGDSMDAAKTDDAAMDSNTAMADGGMFVVEQSADAVTASRYIGQNVLNNADENVGDINDLVFAKDGGIEAAVIGVGGFLGIGEKAVAVRFDAIDIQENPDDGSVTLVIDATKEQLEQAPEFVTKAEQLAEARRIEAEEQMKQQPAPADGAVDSTGTSSINE